MVIRPDLTAAATPFRHTWEGLVNIDQFRWFVRADVQEQLALAHRELGARHVRAVGMFDDELRVLTRDPARWRQKEQRHVEPNWQIDTYIIERLLAAGVNPMITTCFMPGVLAAGERTVFETKSRISLPKDWGAWRALVRSLVRHLVDHFGLDVVRGFYFEVWNEPNLRNGFFEGSQEDFFRLYLETARTIKEVDPLLKVGGPSTAHAEWIPEFLQFCRANDLEPDYIIGHIYNNDGDIQPLSPFDGPQEDRTSKSPNFASGVIRGTRKLLDDLGYKGEVHWNEWGRSWFPHEPVRETANEAAFIAKTMAEVSQLADYFAYWCLSDVYDQVGYGGSAFHGNYGLLNLQGLRKPGYHAFQLLGRMGRERIPVAGEGLDAMANALATRSGKGGAEILVYRYDGSSDPVPGAEDVRVELPRGASVRALTMVTPMENNILEDWRAAGSPAYLKADVLAALRARNTLRPSAAYSVEDTPEGRAVSFRMGTPGIALLEVAGVGR